MPHYCSKGHENPLDSRFCLECGQELDREVSQGIQPGLVLGDRYRIVRQLGHGGFGSTYLGEDINKFSESCVLKEFAPLISQSPDALQKAEEVLEREANALYQLQHPQIPRCRELFQVDLDGNNYLFLVQDYCSGQTYRALLDARNCQGVQFSEVEVTKLLLQILPVLEYIHSMGVIHQDICPDNLILRSSDYLPVLIDFGGVNQVAATVASQFNQPVAGKPPSPATLGEKLGYAPYEQIQMGIVYTHTDLYALAATVLVLLTGKEPKELIDEITLTWNWQREVSLSPTLGAVLDKMLLPRSSKRYQSAREVLQALSEEGGGQGEGGKGLQGQRGRRNSFLPVSSFTLRKTLLLLLLLVGTGGVGWWGGNLWLKYRKSTLHSQDQTSSASKQTSSSTATNTPKSRSTSPYAPQEEARWQVLSHRGKELGIDEDFLFGNGGLVNQVFYSQHPELEQIPLNTGTAAADLRSQWNQTADALLDTLDNQLSPEARKQLGSYTPDSTNRAKAEVNKLHLSSRSLYDLADAAFFQLFPEQWGQDFLNQPVGQVWQGLVADKVKAVKAGTILKRIVLTPGARAKSVSGSLKTGQGKAYIAILAKDQLMELNLQANPTVLLSVYSPSGKTKILEASSDHSWSGKLPESGFYEFVIVSMAPEPADYHLKVKVEKPTGTSSVESSPPDTATPSPTTGSAHRVKQLRKSLCHTRSGRYITRCNKSPASDSTD